MRSNRNPPLTPAEKGRSRALRLHRALKARGCSFEPIADVEKKQKAMLRRNADMQTSSWECLAYCKPEDLCRDPGRCQSACLLGSWLHRGELIAKVHDRLQSEPYEAFLVTLVRRAWARDLGDLTGLKPTSLHRWLQRRLSACGNTVKGVACVDVSMNVVDGRTYWQGHIHAVLTAPSKDALMRALKVPPSSTASKPCMAKQVHEDDLAHVLAYVTKPLPEGRVAYIAQNGRQGQRYVHVPSRPMREHDAWRMGMRMPERLKIIGMRIGRSGT